MHISGIETALFVCPPAGRQRGTGTTCGGCIVELLTDSGLRGIAVGPADLRTELGTLTRQYLKGEDPRAAPALWQRMLDGQTRSRASARTRAAMALLDVALWDLKARANNEPLWKTLGGARPGANAVACCNDGTLTEAERVRWFADRYRESGCNRFMLPAESAAGVDGRCLGKLRKLANGAAELAVDAAGTWTPAQALRRVRALEKHFDLAWIALAAPPSAVAGLKKLSDSVRAAVCAGRGLGFPGDFLPHFQARSIDLVQVDPGVNGITGSLQLADAAFGFELPVMVCAAPGNIQAQLAGAMPYVMNVEVTTSLPELFTNDVHIESGRVIAGDAPGNGLALDRTALARYRVDRLPGRRRGP